jgi:hypothetical protein
LNSVGVVIAGSHFQKGRTGLAPVSINLHLQKVANRNFEKMPVGYPAVIGTVRT